MPNPPPDLYDEVHTKSDNTGWFVGIIVALALLAIGYLVFSTNTGPASNPGPMEWVTRTLLIDRETGCQYVDGSGTTPRLDRDGKQICRPLETK